MLALPICYFEIRMVFIMSDINFGSASVFQKFTFETVFKRILLKEVIKRPCIPVYCLADIGSCSRPGQTDIQKD